jgi:predicted DNA-binding transcriptional regulator AlpA
MPGIDFYAAARRRLLRDRDVAAALNISVRLVWKLAASGDLPVPMRLGRATRWRAEDIDRLIAAGAGGDQAANTRAGSASALPSGDEP